MSFSQSLLTQALSPILQKSGRQATHADLEAWAQIARAWLKDAGESDEDILSAFAQMVEQGTIKLRS